MYFRIRKLLKENQSMIRAANMLITIVPLKSNHVTDTKGSWVGRKIIFVGGMKIVP